MAVFHPISGVGRSRSIKLHKTFNMITGSDGLSSIQFVSSSNNVNLSSSYWESLRTNFYLSGSDLSQTEKKFNGPSSYIGYHFTFDTSNSTNSNKQHRNKFYESGSIINISQKYIGHEIKKKSFILNDKSSDKTIIIKDDGYGNLYSTNAHHSQSNNSVSSSDNYIGNIFYDLGIAVVTETGSWSGSVNYTTLGTTNYDVEFKSTDYKENVEYVMIARPGQFYGTNNPTAYTDYTVKSQKKLLPALTGSGWLPYATSIGLYDADPNTNIRRLVAVAKLSQPIKMIDWGDLIFKINMDM